MTSPTSSPRPSGATHARARTPRGRATSIIVALAALTGLVVLAAALAPAAFAQAVPRLEKPVTDLAEVLNASEEARVTATLARVRDEDGVQLFVLYVDTTGAETAVSFAEATAAVGSLGGNDALLLVAFDDRTYALWVSDALDVTDAEIDDVLVNAVEPRLRAGDAAGAAIDGALALGAAATGTQTPTLPPATAAPTVPATPTATAVPGGTGGGGASGGGTNLLPIVAVVLVGGGLYLVGRTLLTRRAMARADGSERGRLGREANSALLAADEALRDAEQEVGFAEAQWGEAVAAPYRAAIAAAADELRAAFAVRQRLDDDEPDTPDERAAMLKEILARSAAARAAGEEQVRGLAELRDLERTAPEQLAALPAAIEALRTRHAAAEATARRLFATYAPSAFGSIAGNVEEAGKALATALEEAERGRALPDLRRREAALALRRAQESTAAASRLMEAVERLAGRLDEAAARAPEELAAADADVARARAGAAGAEGAAAAGASEVGRAEALLAEARRTGSVRPLDPLAALEQAAAAHRAADEAIAAVEAAEQEQRRRVEAAEQQRQRQVALASGAIASATARVGRAVDYITTRRHGVGQTARVRAAEAESRLRDAQALAASDPARAVEAARRAEQLADEAYRLASGEFDAWDRGNGPVAGPYRRGAGASPEAQVVGAVLGGILGGILSGGARGSGWGGTPWGGSQGGGGGSRGSRGGFGLPPGPFGGGARPGGGGRSGGGRAGGGGGPSGGGGHARGGRW